MSIECCRLGRAADEAIADQWVFDAADIESRAGEAKGIVLTVADEERAAQLLSAGARQVLLGEAALADSETLRRLAGHWGSERVGIVVAVRRQLAAWSFETVSNADFKVVTPSLCEPTWEVLRADGGGTGTHAVWWIGQMCERGAGSVLLLADIADDDDLNLCAGLVEQLGERLWVAPRSDAVPALADWIALGQVRQLALPPALYARRAEWLAAGDANDSGASDRFAEVAA